MTTPHADYNVNEVGGAYQLATHTPVNVNGDTLVITANPIRVYLLITNASNTPVYIRWDGAAAVVNTGHPVGPGDSYEMSASLGNLYRGLVRANHGAGAVNKLLLVTEGTMEVL